MWLKASGKKVRVNAILDDASNESFLHENVASLLGIQESFQKVQVHVLNSEVEIFQSMPIMVDIESVSGGFKRTIVLKTRPHQVRGTYKVEDWCKNKEQCPHLEKCDFPRPAGSCFVDLLIGVDNADLHYSMAHIRGPPGGPVARLGLLGWICIGRSKKQNGSSNRSRLVHSFCTIKQGQVAPRKHCCDINDTLQKFWEVESYGTDAKRAEVMTKEEKTALEKVKTSLTCTGSRYRLSVPW